MSDNYEVGYGRPPRKHQFKAGQSGNPRGRPRKPKAASDTKSMFTRIANEELDVNGKKYTVKEVVLRNLFNRAMKGEASAVREVNRLNTQFGIDQPEQRQGGVLVVPSVDSFDDWQALAYKQQAKFRSDQYLEGKGIPDDDGDDVVD